MKNVTISLDDETYRAARIRAAELGTSLSALVKEYLNGLADGPLVQGVREMPMPYIATPAVVGAGGPPYLINGQWVYTKDGKPRLPGALNGLSGAADDFDEWPPEMLAFFEKLQSDPLDDGLDALP